MTKCWAIRRADVALAERHHEALDRLEAPLTVAFAGLVPAFVTAEPGIFATRRARLRANSPGPTVQVGQDVQLHRAAQSVEGSTPLRTLGARNVRLISPRAVQPG
jgi:hypothetical protein